MAKTFGQYTGGIQAIQGINEFGAQQAAGIERTMGGLANTITKTYDTLNQQEEENSANREEIKGYSDHLTQAQKLILANPDNKDSDLSKGLEQMIASLNGSGNLNRGQLKGVLARAKLYAGNLPLTMQMQDKANLVKATAGIQTALAGMRKMTVKDSQGYDIKMPMYAGGSPEKYQKDLRTMLEQHKKDNPSVELDVDKAVRDSIQGYISHFTNDPDLKKNDPTYQQQLIRGFEGLAKRDAAIPEAGTGNEEDVYKAMDLAAEADRNASGDLQEIRRNEIAAANALEAQRKAGTLPALPVAPEKGDKTAAKPQTADEKFEEWKKPYTEKRNRIEELDKVVKNPKNKVNGVFNKEAIVAFEERSKLQVELKRKEDEIKALGYKDIDSVTAEGWKSDKIPPPSVSDIKAGVDKELEILKKKEAELEASIAKGAGSSFFTKNTSPIERTATNVQELIKDFVTWGAEKQADTAGTGAGFIGTSGILPPQAGAMLAMAGGLGMFDNRTQAKKELTKAAIEKEIASKFPTTPENELKSVKERLATSTEVSTQAKSIISPEAEVRKPDMYDQGFDYQMTIPSVMKGERPLTYEEEKDGIRKWFEENHNGVVPSTIDSIYKTIRPEAALIIKTLPTGEKLMWNGEKGWSQLTQMAAGKQLTDEEISDKTLYNFGQIVDGRRVPAEARTGSGIMVNGNFGGGKVLATEFNRALTDTASLIESVPQLVEMFKKTGHSIQLLNQTEQGIAKSLLVKIRAAIRVETIGTGPIAIAEHKMLMDRLGDPNALFTLDKHEIAKLQSILDTSKSQLKRTGVGLNITFRPPSVAGSNPVQQNRLDNAIQQRK